jgi:hypothetical protein
MTRGGCPRHFWDVWQTKDFKPCVFGCVAMKGLRERFFGTVASKGVSEISLIFTTNDIIRDNICQSLSEYWNEKVGFSAAGPACGKQAGRSGAAPLQGKRDVVWQNILVGV